MNPAAPVISTFTLAHCSLHLLVSSAVSRVRSPCICAVVALALAFASCNTQRIAAGRVYNSSGRPWPIPGTIEAENYDEGTAADPAYRDFSPGSAAPADQHYRDGDVDLGVGPILVLVDVGWIESGEWLEYTVHVGHTGLYRVAIRIATPLDHTRLHLEFNGVDRTGAIRVPTTGCWGSDLRGGQCFQEAIVGGVHLEAGAARMRLVADTGRHTIDRMTFTGENP